MPRSEVFLKWPVLLAIALAGCGSQEQEQQGSGEITILLPPAEPYVPPAKGEAATKAGVERAEPPAERPKLTMATGVCMGRWRPHYFRRGGPSFVLTVSRDGTYEMSGGLSKSGRWRPVGSDLMLDGDRLFECGRTISHLATDGREYSLRRA